MRSAYLVNIVQNTLEMVQIRRQLLFLDRFSFVPSLFC